MEDEFLLSQGIIIVEDETEISISKKRLKELLVEYAEFWHNK